jgi:murein DD-endopeptidase MepM/ murein hydrolase activator NlpD
MRLSPLVASVAPITVSLLCAATPTAALAGSPGGTQAPSAQQAGGSEFGVAPLVTQRPVLTQLSVPRTVAAGRMPRVSFRIEEPGVGTVSARVSVISLTTRKRVVSVALGWVHTRRTVAVRWPAARALSAGSYQLSVSARDHRGGTLVRAHSAGLGSFTVKAPTPPPSTTPTPVPTPPVSFEAGVPTPAQTAAAGAAFPVAGAHSYGDAANRFGAPRSGHTHQGQDVLTAEGTPIVAPMSGTILWTSYQATGAGYYAVEHTTVGFDFMFAHCQAGSLAVATGSAVSAGQVLCAAGQTGDATTPHLHFEMWVGGWQASSGHPIDPLPYLEAWDHSGAAAS